MSTPLEILQERQQMLVKRHATNLARFDEIKRNREQTFKQIEALDLDLDSPDELLDPSGLLADLDKKAALGQAKLTELLTKAEEILTTIERGLEKSE